jgi:spore coat protein B
MGMNVRINRGGPESLDGRMIGVQKGYLVLRNSTGNVYVNSSHVKSVTELPTNSSRGHSSRGMSQSQFIKADGFNGVLHALTRKFVQINWGGPEKIEGFIAQVGNQTLMLVVGQELVQIPLYHIKTVKTAGIYASGGSKGSQGSRGTGGSSGSGGNKSGGNSGGNARGNRNASAKGGRSSKSRSGK